MLSKTHQTLVKLFPRLKKNKIKTTDDLVKKAILDSMDLVTLVTRLKKNYKFDIDKYQKKFNKFTIKNLDNFLK